MLGIQWLAIASRANLTLLSIRRRECLQRYPRLVSVPAQACYLGRVFLTTASVL